MTLDRCRLVGRQWLAREPLSAATIEQIGVRAARDQVCMQYCMDLIFYPRSMLDDLIAPTDQAAELLGLGIGCPDLRQETGGVEVRQNPGVNLVRFNVRVGDRLYCISSDLTRQAVLAV
jgi:hypothetical protein